MAWAAGDGGVLLFGLGLVHHDLRFGLPDVAVGRGQIGVGLVHQHLVIARINFQQHVARLDVLVVRHQQLDHRAGNTGADKGDVTFDESVVRRFVGRDEANIIIDRRRDRGQRPARSQ